MNRIRTLWTELDFNFDCGDLKVSLVAARKLDG